MIKLADGVDKWKATQKNIAENVQNLVKAFQDPAVQEFLRTDPSVKDLLIPIDAK